MCLQSAFEGREAAEARASLAEAARAVAEDRRQAADKLRREAEVGHLISRFTLHVNFWQPFQLKAGAEVEGVGGSRRVKGAYAIGGSYTL